MSDLNFNEMTIAIIGLIGVLVTALLSNWEKLFPKKNEVKATFSGYRATGDFETELRYYFEVSGTRATSENMNLQIAQNYKMILIQQNPEISDLIDAMFSVSLEEAITVDEVIKKLLPVYRKFYSIEELQELNKFYSTELMRNMLKKMKALTIEAAPLQVELMEDFDSRLKAKFDSRLKAKLVNNLIEKS